MNCQLCLFQLKLRVGNIKLLRWVITHKTISTTLWTFPKANSHSLSLKASVSSKIRKCMLTVILGSHKRHIDCHLLSKKEPQVLALDRRMAGWAKVGKHPLLGLMRLQMVSERENKMGCRLLWEEIKPLVDLFSKWLNL